MADLQSLQDERWVFFLKCEHLDKIPTPPLRLLRSHNILREQKHRTFGPKKHPSNPFFVIVFVEANLFLSEAMYLLFVVCDNVSYCDKGYGLGLRACS